MPAQTAHEDVSVLKSAVTTKRLYSIVEAASALGVGRTTIYAMRKAGLIRFGKLLNRTVISAEEIDRVVAEATAVED